MSEETFEDWFNEWVLNRWKEQGVILLEDALERAGENAMDCSAEAAWNHQQNKIDELEKEIKDYQEGWLGCCHTCEPVAIKNQWQNEVVHRLVEKLNFVLDRFDTIVGGEAGMNHIRKFCNDVKKTLEQIEEKGE